MKELGLYNVIFEIDLGETAYDFNTFTVDKMCEFLKKWIVWSHENLDKDAKVMINFRDIPEAMSSATLRVFQVVDYLCKLPENLRLFGLMYEEPNGTVLIFFKILFIDFWFKVFFNTSHQQVIL